MKSKTNYTSHKRLLGKRLETLKKKLSLRALDSCFINAPFDLLYYTGLKLSAGYLIVSQKSASLFVDGRYIQLAEEKAPMRALLDKTESFEECLKKEKIKRMVFDSGCVSYDQFLNIKKKGKSIGVQLLPDAHFFQSLRAVKDQEEIEKLRTSAHLAYEGFLFIKTILKIGITEREVARRFEIFCLEKGADKLSFEPIIAFGVNTAMPHYRSQEVALKSGDIVLIDIGVVLNDYHSDMTRVLFFQKQIPFFQHIYEVVRSAHQAVLAECRPGILVKQLDLVARKVMHQEELETHFLHSLGHGIGLETHEFPRLTSRGKNTDICLESHMAVTVEPGLYFQGKGGIRYEDTVIVTETGYENLYPQMENILLN